IAQRREYIFGDEGAISLPELGMPAKEGVQCRVRRLAHRQHRGERVGERLQLTGTQRHCCATVWSTRILSSRNSTVARVFHSRIFAATKCSDGAIHTRASSWPSPLSRRHTCASTSPKGSVTVSVPSRRNT